MSKRGRNTNGCPNGKAKKVLVGWPYLVELLIDHWSSCDSILIIYLTKYPVRVCSSVSEMGKGNVSGTTLHEKPF
jgi:hypothetical protein